MFPKMNSASQWLSITVDGAAGQGTVPYGSAINMNESPSRTADGLCLLENIAHIWWGSE